MGRYFVSLGRYLPKLSTYTYCKTKAFVVDDGVVTTYMGRKSCGMLGSNHVNVMDVFIARSAW